MIARPHFDELLDAADAAPQEVDRALADLRRMNRWLGGRSVLLGMLASEVRRLRLTRFSLLDVRAGSGDQALAVRARYPRASVFLCDLNSTHMPKNGLPRITADALRLPFRDAEFDFISASLMLHHFRDRDVIRLLSHFGRVARFAVLINDLERHWFPVVFIKAAAPIFARSPITRHDAPASVRQAFRPRELRDFAREAGFGDIEVRRHLPWFRLSLIARNPQLPMSLREPRPKGR